VADRLEAMAGAFRESLKTVEENTEAFLRDAILSGGYKPGDRLRQGEIATLLGVSRMPVRTSLRALEAEGLVEIKPNVGAVVSVLRPEQIAEIYELRELLEVYLLRRAAAAVMADQLEDMRVRFTEPTETGAEPASSGWNRRHEFYHALYSCAGRPRAVEMADRLRLSVGRFFLQRRVDDHLDADSHIQLIDRLSAGDIDGAEALLREHLRLVSEQLQQLVTVSPETAATR
jgi:DNA-binding GntR family transcriptional regulator